MNNKLDLVQVLVKAWYRAVYHPGEYNQFQKIVIQLSPSNTFGIGGVLKASLHFQHEPRK